MPFLFSAILTLKSILSIFDDQLQNQLGLMLENKGISAAHAKQIDEAKQGEVFSSKVTKQASKSFYIESYGCAMNFSDSEIVASILGDNGYAASQDINTSDLLLINTCSIREKAEDNVRKRLRIFDKMKKQNPGTLIGVLGCMAERLKTKFLEEEKLVDFVVGPDAYRDIPDLISTAEEGDRGVNVLLSREETYADVSPVRLNSNGVTAFISIMRGCDNMCSFCVVPFTRGRERSRDLFSIVSEADDLFKEGYREVTLLGQNVDSYKWTNPDTQAQVSFTDLLEAVAMVAPLLRVRFMTSHPKDITDEVLHMIAKHHNICNYIHLPAQSGNSRILKLMNRTYDRPWYEERVKAIRRILPDCAFSSDIITGFCTETEDEHQDTLDLIQWAKFSISYMYYYSERPGTQAAKKYEDDIPYDVKKRRLAEIVALQREVCYEHNVADIGKTFEVLIEGDSKKSELDFKGKNSQNKVIIFPKQENLVPGDYVEVLVTDVTSATLKGRIVN